MNERKHFELDTGGFCRSVTQTTYSARTAFASTPDNCWDFVFFRSLGRVSALRTGLTTGPVQLDFKEGDCVLTVSFSASAHMAMLPGQVMLNAGVELDTIGADRFRLGGDVVEIPRFDNVESFVSKLRRSGLVEQNYHVASVLSGHTRAMTERTMQRHFLNTTGMTYKNYTQIERARKAVELLRSGTPAAEAALELGYADQPHLIRSLKSVTGQTPRQILA